MNGMRNLMNDLRGATEMSATSDNTSGQAYGSHGFHGPGGDEAHTLPPSSNAPGRVLLVAGGQATAAIRALQLAGHALGDCHTLAGLCLHLKYQQPDVICIHERAVGQLDQVVRIIRGRHTTVPLVLVAANPNPGLGPIRLGFYAAVPEEAGAEALMVAIAHAVAHHRMLKRINHLEVEASGRGFAGIAGTSPMARRVFRKVQAFAAADVHVLLEGEAGTGKSLAARAIHDHSARARGPFIALNCERLSDTAFSADAFVNAHASPSLRPSGAIDDADRGTLYLANIDSLSPTLQEQLLAALTSQQGSDFRLIASTQTELSEAVSRGLFRPELMQHIAHSHLTLLPLRARPIDIPVIASALLETLAREQGKPRLTLSKAAASALERHPYRRNVSELREILQTAIAAAQGTVLNISDLPAIVQGPALVGAELGEPLSRAPDSAAQRQHVLFEMLAQKPMKIRDLERCAIEATLQRTGENVTQAMRELGIGRTTLYRKLKKYGKR